ncbi:spore germination protein [Paenibacillus sp. DXFW5]|uniref:Spore germination protein n=1 Tax=Paenibacillus rhizolycopersici TaxID=2780073 RepID=A0ABS2H5B1_9BACL|nr:spore germination protein [Paenibacillus rhizolycopersici]MBM6996642.1 spore germination protein [Paenibacillus rhizolycopersici]
MPRFMFRNQHKRSPVLKSGAAQGDALASSAFGGSVHESIAKIVRILDAPDDLVTRFVSGGEGIPQCGILCIAGLSDLNMINEQIVTSLQQAFSAIRHAEKMSGQDLFDLLNKQFLSVQKYKITPSLDDVLVSVLSGDTAFFIDGLDQVLLIASKKWTGRSVEEPQTEALVRGPREGFNESIETNIILLRRAIRDPKLRFDTYRVGARSKKELVITYIDNIVHPDLVQEVKRRVETIDIDDAPESGTIEQLIQDSFLSPFPLILHTERPDKVASAVLQGKVVILLDGTPFALIMPTTFVSLIQSPEDYYERWHIGSLIRMLRYFAVVISLTFPSLYIALVSFHQGMIPSKLAFSIAAAREGVPFPAVVEAFLMEFTLELLREAGVRLPKPIGQTIGIVGGLVIGEAAVQAGIVSPIMVIVVAVTAVASFAIPSYSAGITFRMLRFCTMLAASMFGLYGIIMTIIMICIHMSRLQSFGVPYFTPMAPFFSRDWRDMLIRAPLTMLTKRPKFMQTQDEERMSDERGGQ